MKDDDHLLLLLSTSAPKRRLTATPSVPALEDSMDSLLETFLGLLASSDRASVDLALERIVEARACDSEKSQVVETAVSLGKVLVEAALSSKRKIASRHNAASWRLPLELTVKVFSMLDTRSQCYAAATCSLLNKFACDPVCYANIDLTSMSPRVNNTVVSTMIQRAEKNLRSLKLGSCVNRSPVLSCSLANSIVNPVDASVPSWNDKKSRLGKESSGLTRSCLLALSMNGGTSGALLRSLYLYNIEKMDNTALCRALSSCKSLLDLEVIGLHVELRQILESLSTNCHYLERLFFESSKTGRDDSLKSSTCTNFINGCPSLTTFALRGFKLPDHKIRILVKGFHKLKSVDFSTSYAITGNFLRNLGGSNGLEVLILRDCLHLKEVEVTHFLSACLSGDCKSLTFLDISNRDGLSAEEDWYHRLYEPSGSLITRIHEERPDIHLVAEFHSDKSMFETEELIEDELNSDISFPSQMSLDSMSTSGSTYSSDHGSGSEDGNNVHVAVNGESLDGLDYRFW